MAGQDGQRRRDAHARSGGDIHTVKETLRHSTITLASDTYTSLLPELDREIAEKAAKLIPRSRQAAAEPSAQTAADPQATATSAHASLTQWLENAAAPDPTEADSGAA
ncbi:hypothetical protein GCM10010276_55950 [Streptomyces longisporus]|uniref:Integrase n=1 Tax=Streptomyces longisporus TaxID=1948 RepID=A0ABN3MRQ8_STRLO